MPPLLTPSPTILDQTFPRDLEHVKLVLQGLGELQAIFDDNRVHLLLPNALAEWMLNYVWAPPENCFALNDLYQYVSQLFLSPRQGLIRLDLTSVECKGEEYHPAIGGSDSVGMSQKWQLEMGKLFKVHKNTCTDGFYIGIGCEFCLCGRKRPNCESADLEHSFPLIGAGNLSLLYDAYNWVTEAGILGRDVTVAQARKNIFLLGANKISKPKSGSSHYSVHFTGARSWPLDSNDDPVPLTYLRELVPITNFPIEVIIHVLLYGEYPAKRLKIPVRYVIDA